MHAYIDNGVSQGYNGLVQEVRPMHAYKGFTEAQAKAHKKYMETVATIQVRTREEERKEIKAHAAMTGESINAFVLRAIRETIRRDRETTPPGGMDEVAPPTP